MDSPFPWWEWNVIDNSVEFNDLKATMLGYDPAQFRLKGYQAFTDLLHEDDYEKTMDAMRMLLTGQTDLYQIDYRIRAADNSYHWYMDRGIVVERTGDNKIEKLRGIVIDLGNEVVPGSSREALVSLFENTVISEGTKSTSMLTLCAACKKAKVENEIWIPVSKEIASVAGEKISHGICPDCMTRLYPDLADKVLKKIRKTD